jgi:hypothetical protein
MQKDQSLGEENTPSDVDNGFDVAVIWLRS